MSPKLRNYGTAQSYGTEAAFLANVILTRHGHGARKLAGLVVLLARGHECRISQHDIDVLVIDGRCFAWEVLETPNLVMTSPARKGAS